MKLARLEFGANAVSGEVVLSSIGPKTWVQCLCTLPSTSFLAVGTSYYVERVVDAWDEDRETMRSALVLSGCPYEEAYPPEWFRPLGGERQSTARQARQARQPANRDFVGEPA